MARNGVRSILYAGAVLAFLMSFVFGQEHRGRVQGVVADASGAVIPGAAVKLPNVHTGISVNRQTGGEGHYLFDLVEPGTCSVTVEIAGFNKFADPGLQRVERIYSVRP